MRIPVPFLLGASLLIGLFTTHGLKAVEPSPLTLPFNSQNKGIAKTVYQLIGDIQDSEFDPATNIAALTKLQDAVSQTEFASLPALDDYIRDALTMNSSRSKDLKVDASNVD